MCNFNFLVSVIVPVYNVEKFICDCVKSIIGQTYDNLQIILVDDGSTDNSGKICDHLGLLDKRIQIVHKENGGLSSARNAGLDVATGEFISFIDSDDFIDKYMIEKLLNVINDSRADVASCAISRYYYHEDKLVPYIHFKYNERITEFNCETLMKLHLLCKIDTSVCNKLFSRKSILGHRFYEGIINEDFLFSYFLYQKIDKLVYLNEPLYFYRFTENSISNTLSKKSFDVIKSGFFIKEDISKNNLPLKTEVDRYLYGQCFSYCLTIKYIDKTGLFYSQYIYLKDILKININNILKNKHFPITRKIAMLIYVKNEWFFDKIYRALRMLRKNSSEKSIDYNKI